jgi:zinc transporter ZupT
LGFAGIIAIFALAVAGVLAGTRLAEVRDLSRKVLAISGAILIAVSVFGILPEVAARSGWRTALLSLAVGFAALWAVDRFVYPICPACSHHHEHEAYGGHLHGFAAPLLIAIGVHSFLDGWGFAASGDGSHFLQLAFLLGIALHKIPEGLALGAIVRAAISSHWKSLLACVAAESMTLAGGAAAFGLAARLGAAWEAILLAGAAGTFVYLGYHALEGVIHERIRSTRLVRLLSGKHVL